MVILKPFHADEARFYCRLHDGQLAALLPFTPMFYGTKKLRREQIEDLAARMPNKKKTMTQAMAQKDTETSREPPQVATQHVRRYLVLEDLGSTSVAPCFLDLKVGCRQRAARYGAQKRAHMAVKAAQSTSASLGFRICGMQCFSPKTGTVQRYDKYWGQQVTAESMGSTLARFFTLGEDADRGPLQGTSRDLVQRVLDKLGRLQDAVLQLPGARFWGGSVLVFFDAALAAEPSTDAFFNSLRLKTIDFANFEDVGGDCPDEEYLCGIANIKVFLQALLDGSAFDAPSQADLASPPPPSRQDAEQQGAWEALQRSLKARVEGGGCAGGDLQCEDGAPNPNLAANAQTISGATGRTLLRELASSHHLVRVNENEGASPNANLAELFD